MLAKRSLLIGTFVFEQTAPASLRDGIPALLRRGINRPTPQILFWLRFDARCFLCCFPFRYGAMPSVISIFVPQGSAMNATRIEVTKLLGVSP